MYPASTLLPALGELLSAVHSGCKDRAHLDEKAMMVLMAASKDAEKALLAQAALLRVAELEQQVATLQVRAASPNARVLSSLPITALTNARRPFVRHRRRSVPCTRAYPPTVMTAA